METKLKGKPRLDYYIGRMVTGVSETEDGYDIVLDGNIRISNTDGRRSVPDGIVGLSFIRPILSAEETRLQFGRVRPGREILDPKEVTLTPNLYRISDERYEGGPHFPQADMEVEIEIPEEPQGRDADGPETLPVTAKPGEDAMFLEKVEPDQNVVLEIDGERLEGNEAQ